MMDMKSLNSAKARRTAARTVVDEAENRAAADAADLLVCEGHAAELVERRAGSVAAAKPDDVIAVDERLRTARVNVEVAQSKAAASARARASATVELHAAKLAVDAAAATVAIGEMVNIAIAILQSSDHMLTLGARLRDMATFNSLHTSLSASIPTLPPEVTAALERLPREDELHVSTAVLRNGQHARAWTERLAELTT
jgi:hypothetical protein